MDLAADTETELPLDETADDAACIAALVAVATRGRASARAPWAHALVDSFGGLAGLSRADVAEIEASLLLSRVPRAGPAAASLAAAFELGRRVARAEAPVPERLVGSADVAAWATPRLGRLVHEELWLLGLDGRSRLRAARRLAQGGLHGMGVRAPDVLRTALRVGASGFVLVHNHPSGDPTASAEDVAFTRAVAEGAAKIGLPLLDHVIVAGDVFSTVADGSA
jgi:DNA repair protein RadC